MADGSRTTSVWFVSRVCVSRSWVTCEKWLSILLHVFLVMTARVFTALVVDFGSHRRPWGCECSWGGSPVSPQVLSPLPGSDLPPSLLDPAQGRRPRRALTVSVHTPCLRGAFVSLLGTDSAETPSLIYHLWSSLSVGIPRASLYLVCDPAVPTA